MDYEKDNRKRPVNVTDEKCFCGCPAKFIVDCSVNRFRHRCENHSDINLSESWCMDIFEARHSREEYPNITMTSYDIAGDTFNRGVQKALLE